MPPCNEDRLECRHCGRLFKSLAQHKRQTVCGQVVERKPPVSTVGSGRPSISSIHFSAKSNISCNDDSSVLSSISSCLRIPSTPQIVPPEQRSDDNQFAFEDSDFFPQTEDDDLRSSVGNDEETNDAALSTAAYVNRTDCEPASLTCPGTVVTNESANSVVLRPSVDFQGIDLFSRQDYCCLRLVSFCDDRGCSRSFYDDLMKLLQELGVQKSFDITQAHPRRETVIRRLQTACPTPAPIPTIVALENSDLQKGNFHQYSRGSRDEVTVCHYDFVEQLIDLLSDQSIFGDVDNLDVNKNDPFGKFVRDDGRVNEVNSGSWYQSAYDRLITDKENEFLLPLILYVDKTGTDVMQRYGLEPVLFTTSVISLHKRQSNRAWRPLGFVPDLCARSSAVKEVAAQNDNSKGRSHRDYHRCMEVILKSLVEAQRVGVFVQLRLGDYLKTVRLHIPVAFVINDAKSADMLCGRYGGYSKGRISRSCLTTFEDCSDTTGLCRYVVKSDVSSLQSIALDCCEEDKGSAGAIEHTDAERFKARAELHLIKTHVLRNAFDVVCFGGDLRGIYGCSPTDLMHAFNEGVLKYCMQNLFSKFVPTRKARIDDLVDSVVKNQRSSVRSQFPRTDFSKGFSNLTLLTATEWVGVCFTMLIIVMLERGKEIVMPAMNPTDFEGHPDDEESSSDKDDNNRVHRCSLQQLIELLEALLSFHAWTKLSESFVVTDAAVRAMKESMTCLLDMVKIRLPRNEGNGWRIQKFHEMLHVPDDIVRFGSPRNTDAGPGERSLKHFAKRPARTSQKRQPVFQGQVCGRLHENASFDKAKRLTDPEDEWGTLANLVDPDDVQSPAGDDGEVISKFPTQQSRYSIYVDHETGQVETSWIGDAVTKGLREIHPIVLAWFREENLLAKFTGTIHCFTEYVRGTNRFRAHPNFRSDGSWYDWVEVRFSDEDDEELSVGPRKRKMLENDVDNSENYFASKILCFFEETDTLETYAVVHTSNKSTTTNGSTLIDECYLEYQEKVTYMYDKSGNQRGLKKVLSFPVLRCVPVSSFGNPILVFQERHGLFESVDRSVDPHFDRCLVVKSRQEWCTNFPRICGAKRGRAKQFRRSR